MGARAKRAQRVRAAIGPIWDQLAAFTDEAHQGLTFHGGRAEVEGVWFATPFEHHRDSDALDESNFEVITDNVLKIAPDGAQVNRFGHWGHGWYERLYVRRDDPAAINAVAGWLRALADYPIADEDHFSAKEYEMDHPGDGLCYSEDPDDCSCGNTPA